MCLAWFEADVGCGRDGDGAFESVGVGVMKGIVWGEWGDGCHDVRSEFHGLNEFGGACGDEPVT